QEHRAPTISAAAQNNVPAAYGFSFFSKKGGFFPYGVDYLKICGRPAPFCYAILRGRRPRELPFQLPPKFEMAGNPKTPKALGLTVPQSILLRADEVIE